MDEDTVCTSEHTYRVLDYCDAQRSVLLRWRRGLAEVAAMAEGSREACMAAMRLLTSGEVV